MSLITIDRSLFTSDVDSNGNTDGPDAIDKSSRSSQSEDFLMCKATAVGLNVRSRRRSSYIKPNDDIQDHLKKILGILRFGDYLQLVVRLQSDLPRPHHHRYCCIISTTGKQGTEESVVLGVDLTDRRATVGLVLPIWQDMSVKLFGDGGFELITKDTEKQFKPVSVQALWAAFQSLHRACHVARKNDYFSRGLTHDWVSYYNNLPASDTYQIQEWLKTDDIDGFSRYTLPSPLSEDATDEEKERHRMESLIRVKLQAIMYSVDLEEVTVLQLRERLEDEIGQSLREYRHFIEEEVLTIYGRMDEASVIFDHLLLGTTFNASNRDELERRSVTHILNVTREVDNFFPGDKFEYKNIRVFDDEQSSLLPYFEDAHRFINEAKAQGTCCLVHCKMGISRSATTVIAYAMKEQNWDLKTALAYVKGRRPCVQPNPGFMRELCTYEGILEASSNRHKPIFCKDGTASTTRTSVHANLNATGTSLDLNNSPTDSVLPLNSEMVPSELDVPSGISPQDAKPVSGVLDLEAELFAFKPAGTTVVGACLLPDSTGSVVGLTPSGQPEKCAANNAGSKDVLRTGGPLIVWDLETDEERARTNSDRTTLLARNSHCLRQWHPDLVENVRFSDTTEIVSRGPPADRANEPLCHGDVQFIAPCNFEESVDIPEVTPVPFRNAPAQISPDTEPSDGQPPSSDQYYLIRQGEPAGPLALATITTPVLMYTCVQERLVAGTAVKGFASDAAETYQNVTLINAPSCTSQMASRLTDMSVQAMIGHSSMSTETSMATSTHEIPREACQIPLDHRFTLPSSLQRSYIRSATLNPASPAQMRSSFPPSFSRHYARRVDTNSTTQVPPVTPICSPNSDVPVPTDPSSDQTTNWPERRECTFQAPGLPASPATGRSNLFRSARFPTSPRKSSPINRTQSARAAVTQRLRPDNSWIVCPTGESSSSAASAATSCDVKSAGSTDSQIANQRTRPISSVFPGPERDGHGDTTTAAVPTQFTSPVKCMSIVSGSAASQTQPMYQSKFMQAAQSRKTLQLSTSPRVAPVSIAPVQLSPKRPCSLFTRNMEASSGSSKLLDDSSSADIQSATTSATPTAIKENEPAVRDCSQTPSYLASYRHGRRITSWPPKTADPVATKS